MSRPFTPIAERFWPKVDKDGPVVREGLSACWVWTAARSSGGYGKIGIGGRARTDGYAHRVSWELAFGEIPERKMVLHRCDNRPCVNPDHLFLGVAKDNTADMLAKSRGRHSSKETCPYGHPYDAVRPCGGRRCRTCSRLSGKAYKDRQRAKRASQAFGG